MAKPNASLARPLQGSSLAIHTVEDLARVADILYGAGLTPEGINTPKAVAAVILAGLEVGLCPTQALGSIMLTNGKLSIYGDAALALVRASGLLTSIAEETSGDGDARRATCKVTRKGEQERVFSFSMADAKRAGLIERAKGRGPWATYPDRMMMFRARGWALRDVFPDVLRGLVTYEESADAGEGPRVVQVEAVESPTVAHKELAAASLPPPAQVAAAAVTQPTTLNDADPVGDDQLSEIVMIRSSFLGSKNLKTDDEKKAAWVELLNGYGVESAKQFTRGAAAKFIETEGKKHDPFGHPSTDSKT